jgi:hypothetical protein
MLSADVMWDIESGDTKASAIVSKLQELIEIHGDLYVYSWIDCGFVDEPEFLEADKDRVKAFPTDRLKPAMFVFT